MSGKVSVVNGSQFQMLGANVSVQLYGIEACAMDQIAHYNDVAWRCGVVSAGWLTQLTLGYEVKCLEEGSAGYASIYGRCFLPNGDDIAKLALEAGMALAARQNGQPIESTYGLIEDEARKKKAGIWSSNFVHGGVLYRAGSL
ncbi:thermonuclease family protein [Rhizobium panacihumi]|uniref:thermonuclease family protein n=1 Tax=Rhizobium panacihumi TaxID=2008450 RepID=UPI003D7B2CEE